MTELNSQNTLYAEVSENLSSQFGIALDDIQADSKLAEDLNLDSIDIVDLLSLASDRYSVSLSPLDFEGIETLNEFVMKLDELIKNQTTLSEKE